ncbi:MAG: DUF4157 domain-containing protein [Deferribacteres bacterium]|nr:DUF4157 domain-containing protein [Deferribacteres bacterium]
MEEEDEEPVQVKALSGSAPTVDLQTRLNSLRGSGQPLPDTDRSFMERRFGADFSGVRVHTDSNAVQMNRQLNAQAFTHGRDIYFGAGRYSPGTSSGRRLLAHELTHVVQQGRQVGIANRVTKHSQFATRPDISLKSPIIIQHKRGGKGFFDYFKSCMDSLGLPTPSSLFSTITTATATISAINAAVTKFGTSVTIGELIGAGVLSEKLIAVGGLTASFYLGACIGCLATATGEYLSGGYGLGDVLFDILGPKPGLWIADVFGI